MSEITKNYDLKGAKVAVINAVLISYDLIGVDWRKCGKKMPFPDVRAMIARGLHVIGMDEKRICIELNRDRTSIYHMYKKINNLIETNHSERNRIYKLDIEFANIRRQYTYSDSIAVLQRKTNAGKIDNEEIIIINYFTRRSAIKLLSYLNERTPCIEADVFFKELKNKLMLSIFKK